MKMYNQTIQFEKVALSIFHEVKMYLPPEVIWDYLQERHSGYLRLQNITRKSSGLSGKS